MSLGPVAIEMEKRTRVGEFLALARALTRARGNVLQAARFANTPRAIEILEKSATTPGGISGAWGSQLAEYPSLVAAYLETLRHVGTFDRLLPDMIPVPLRARVVVSSVGITGSTVAESSAKPISQLTLDGATVDEKKATAIIVVSDELLQLGGRAANELFARELRGAVVATTDSQFISLLTDGVSPITASGSTASAIGTDLNAALDAIETGSGSRLYIIVTSDIAKQWSAKALTEGQAFAGMTPQGGILAGIPVVVSDAVDANQWIVVDAAAIAAGAGGIELDASNQASLQADTAPTSPPTASDIPFSLWQHNCVGLRATRYFCAERLHSAAVAVVSGASYSPP